MTRVTIGVPAYNAEGTIAEAVGSLLDQTYRDLEVVVSDNASTDRTVEILEEMALFDTRLRILRQPRNIGANGNYTVLVAEACGEYFKWASSSDWCAPTFVERCVTHLDLHPDVVLAFPCTSTFADSPLAARDYEHDLDFGEDEPVERFVKVLREMRLNNAINGVFRTDVLRRTRAIEHFPGSDVVLMAHIALLGKMSRLPERLYHRRMTAQTATSMQSSEEVLRHHYPTRTARGLLPRWRWYGAQLRAISMAGLPPRQVLRATEFTMKMIYWDRRELLGDVMVALRYPFHQSS